MRHSVKTAFLVAVAIMSPIHAQNVMKTAKVNDMKVELHVFPAEPFFTADQVTAQHVTAGMLIMSGAEPLAPDAASHPNHHLVVHIFESKSGKAVTNAKVSIRFQSLDPAGKPAGTPVVVPIVNMQAIGKGAQSTHYGNNVAMPAGSYTIGATVNGRKVDYRIVVSDAPAEPMNGMNMHEHN
jgi:hypothetical protein